MLPQSYEYIVNICLELTANAGIYFKRKHSQRNSLKKFVAKSQRIS